MGDYLYSIKEWEQKFKTKYDPWSYTLPLTPEGRAKDKLLWELGIKTPPSIQERLLKK